MKPFKSIRWKLQLWYGLILVIVLAGLGLTAYQLEQDRAYRHVDDELQRRAGVLLQAARRTIMRPMQTQRPMMFRWGNGGPAQRPRDDLFGEGFWGPVMGADDFRLQPRDEFLFDASVTNGYYYIVTDADGKMVARSTNAPDILPRVLPRADLALPAAIQPAEERPKPGGPDSKIDGFPPRGMGLPPIQIVPPYFRGKCRELVLFVGNDRSSSPQILVGRNLAVDLADLRHTAIKLTGAGLVILVFGLAGGWWMVNRALRPVAGISLAATKIAAGDLSQRINVAETEGELGQLAAVLNSTFARLESAFAQQKQFASDAAHELRTPVSVILTQTQSALNRERDAASYKQTVEACQRAAQRMRRLIETLLELARFDAGQEQLRRQPLDWALVVGECIEMIEPLARERGVKLVCDVGPAKVTGDPERLAQVVTNLLTNAIQYNHAGGEVRTILTVQPGLAVLTVTDTGSGIAATDLSRVFERFYRSDKSRTGASNSGLGLAISKAIIEAHGGVIEVASVLEKGTAFTVRLPVLETKQ